MPGFAIAFAPLSAGLILVAGVGHATETAGPSASDYAAAARLLEGNLQGLVRNESVEPHWIGDSGRFWYRRDGDGDAEFVVVTAEGAKSPAFDHAGVSRALTETLGRQDEGKGRLGSLAEAQLSDDLSRLSGRVGDTSVDCDLETLRCRTVDTPKTERGLLPSPDGRWAAMTREENLFVREEATGNERQLTNDGGWFYSWGKLPDAALTTIARKKNGLVIPPFETYWSPDGRYLIAPRIDERKVAIHPFVEWVPRDGSRRPIVHEVRSAFTGDRDALTIDYFLFDLETGRRSEIELPEGYQASMLDGLVLGWSRSRGQAFCVARTLGSRSVAVLRLDLAGGSLTKVVEESSATRVELNTVEYNRPNVRVLGDGAELIWHSDRTGFGHLYLYDAQTGRLKNAITTGEWLVHDIQAIDEGHREIYFTAGGREEGRDPYYRHLYRGSLDARADVRLLTEPNAYHHFESIENPMSAALFGSREREPSIHPAAGVFVDTWSTVGEPPVTVLRSTGDGRVIAELERADASALFGAGWEPPVRERVKGAVGTTDLYAVYYAPYGKEAGKTHPVIDAAYGGPQVVVTPRNFIEAYRDRSPLGQSALARLGFAVVTVDGRGTPMRSRAFRDSGYTEFTQVGIDDHVAAIRELARRRPEMDLERVGIYGWSWGGTFSAQAILSRPEFYKVAVSGAGVYDYAGMYPGFDGFIGPPSYADGTHYRAEPDEAPAKWDQLDVTRLADKLAGRLMIIFGDLDENVPPHQAFRLVDALTRAGKSYDLVYLPNRTHAGGGDGYTIKRTWDYFIEHLEDADPVMDVKVEMRPPSSL